MTEEMNEILEQGDAEQPKGLKNFFRRYSALIAWIPTLVLCLLGVVLFLTPVGNVVKVGGETLTGYSAVGGNWMSGLKTPVIVMLILASLSLVAGGLGVFWKRSASLVTLVIDAAAVLLPLAALATGLGQIAWLGTLGSAYKPGMFSILSVVFGAVLLLLSAATLALHVVWLVGGDKEALQKPWIVDVCKQQPALAAWIPTVVLCILGVVLFLAPIGNVVKAGGTTLTGYSAVGGDWMSGLKAPVQVVLVLASFSVIGGVLGVVFKKYRNSLGFDIAALALSLSALATGAGQIAWLGTMSASQGIVYEPGAFSILAVVLGVAGLLVTAGETVIHVIWIADDNQRALWRTTWGRWKGWVYLLPAIILLAVFTVWPIINTFRISMLEDYSVLAAKNPDAPPFAVNFNNFKNAVQYSGFWNCLLNTVLLTVITVPISTMLALIIAVALNSIKPLKRIFQTIFFLPYVTNTIAIGMVFMAMFQMIGFSPTTEPTSVGVINTIIEAFGGSRVNWVNEGSSRFANMFVLCVYIIWNALPFKILVLLGGLQGVNKQYYDAAKVDGASRLRIFWRITVPLLSPMIAYVVITGFIGGFKEYNSVVGIFGTADLMGPPGSFGKPLNTMVGYIYDRISSNQGRASAAALILFAIIFVVTMINMYVSKKKVHY